MSVLWQQTTTVSSREEYFGISGHFEVLERNSTDLGRPGSELARTLLQMQPSTPDIDSRSRIYNYGYHSIRYTNRLLYPKGCDPDIWLRPLVQR